MRVMALIPARAGSKRLRNKNTMELGGLPLWRLAVAQARSSIAIDHIVVSTNDALIKEDPTFVRIQRPEVLCRDDAQTFPVVAHAHKTLLDMGVDVDAICILQPTSPFRTGEDISSCIALMEHTGAEAVVSVSEGPNDLCFQVRHAKRLQRLPEIVIPNGAIYLLRTSALEEGRDWYGDHTYGYIMPKERSLDINVQFDFETAERYLPKMRIE